jgi:hypothetical protein
MKIVLPTHLWGANTLFSLPNLPYDGSQPGLVQLQCR